MISILIPIFNGIEFIDESVKSVIYQSYGEWELLIGINGHPENSPIYQKAKMYESLDNRIKVLDFPTIIGKPATLNELIKYCNYDYIALLDVDDIWHYKKLELQVPFLKNYHVIGTICIYFGDINNVSPDIPLEDISNFDFGKMNPIINSSSITRKELCFWYDKNGIEDYDLWLRLKNKKCKFYNCPEILVKHRIHQNSAFNAKGNSNFVPNLLLEHRNTI